jgi:fermentation-respiration switch protein FrsA (DUF1100 family)
MLVRAVTLEVDGIGVAGQLYLPESEMPYPVVCISHGIPAGIPDPANSGYPLLAERICREGRAVFIFNFRGTGASSGNFDIRGWTSDLRAVIDYLWDLPEADRSCLSLLGFSAGAAVSVYVASGDRRVSSVVAVACPARFTLLNGAEDRQSVIEHFRSIGIIRDSDFPHSLDEWFEGLRLVSPVDCIGGIAPRPLLLVHGSDDELVAVSHARRLYRAASEPKELVIVDGAGHRLRRDERAMAAVIDWITARCRL